MVPSKTLPTMLSCFHTSPSRSLPSAYRQAILALVPVPQGDRSYALPGHSTKFLLSTPDRCDRPYSSTWSISAPPLPVIPPAVSACRIAHVKLVSASTFFSVISRVCSRTRKNQLPPQATSPCTRPYPGTSTATFAASR